MASPDPVRTLIEEARTYKRLMEFAASKPSYDLVCRLASALEASEARGARLSEGIQEIMAHLQEVATNLRAMYAETKNPDRFIPREDAYLTVIGELRSLLASCDKDTQP